jgi:hypothetical protein
MIETKHINLPDINWLNWSERIATQFNVDVPSTQIVNNDDLSDIYIYIYIYINIDDETSETTNQNHNMIFSECIILYSTTRPHLVTLV